MYDKVTGGRRPKSVSLFWKIFDEHFKENNQAFIDVLPSQIGTSRTVIYSWNAAGVIPYRWNNLIRNFMDRHTIKLPKGVEFNDLFGPPRGRYVNGRAERAAYNDSLYLHFLDVNVAYDGNLKMFHDNLVSGGPLLNLPLVMRWIFEGGGIAPTRVRAYATVLKHSPNMKTWRADHDIDSVPKLIEHAYQSGWVAGDQPQSGEPFAEFLERVSEGENALKTKRA